MRYSKKKKKTTFGNILSWLFFISFLWPILEAILGDMFDIVLGGAILLFMVGIPLAALIGVALLIYAVANKAAKNSKSKSKYNNTSNEELLKLLKSYFSTNNQLQIDKDTYLVPTNSDELTLSTIDIYMREEYIGSLRDYLTAFPNAYNSLVGFISKKLTSTDTKKKKKNKKDIDEVLIQPVVEKVTDTDNSRYFIKKFNNLVGDVKNEQVKAGLNETIDYLKQIEKIENEYPDCKPKTRKLYQYYLPMLTDILENYNRLTENAPNYSEFKESEERLLKTIVLINGALKTISSSLAEDYYTDLKVDMKTLESILKKDGLVDDAISKEAGNNE